MKKILPILLITFSAQTLAEITIEEYPKALQGTWLDKTTQDTTKLSFHNSPQIIQIESNGCVATGSYQLQIAVEIEEKSSCWEYECFQMDITVKKIQGGSQCSAQYPVNKPFFMNMRLQDKQTLLFGEDLVFKKR